MIYFDSSALTKLILNEQESADLRQWLAERPSTTHTTSIIGRIETERVVARHASTQRAVAQVFLDTLDILPLTPTRVNIAAELLPTSVRTLDAIHLASALSILSNLDAFLTYDRHLGKAAQNLSIPTVAPGY